MQNSSPKHVSAAEVRDLIIARNRSEIAILDVRPTGTYGDGHLLWANSMPLSTMEIDALDKVPRLDTPIVVCDGSEVDEGLDQRAATKLFAMGYTNVAILSGGLDAWRAAGFEVFSGVNVPSKAFGEFVEHSYDTPRIPPQDLKKLIEDEADIVILDCRPMDEFSSMNIPHGIDVPGAELVLRVHDLAPNPETTVIVNCAGRTRSIIGCQSLRNAGIPNKVYALENGTMGWHLAGYDLEFGKTDTYKLTSEEGHRIAQERAAAVRARFGVGVIDSKTLKAWRADTTRTTYVFDVRDPAEFATGHIPGSRPAPGGQLVQATDVYAATLGARIVCVDDEGVRASMTASWLVQMGWEAVIFTPDAGELSETGPYVPTTAAVPVVPEIRAVALAARMIQTHVVDVGDSQNHRKAHIPGSRFAIRAHLPANLGPLSTDRPVAITSEDGVIAKFAVADLLEAGYKGNVMAVTGGTAGWKEAGLPLTGGFENNLDPSIDAWYRPYDMNDPQEGAMKQYLSWEVNLVRQLERDGTTDFKIFNHT